MAVAEKSKATVVGAGAVGSATAYAMLIRHTAHEVVLYDINETRVRAEALDLAHGAMFTGSSSVTGSANIADTAGSRVIVVTAGAAQKPGQTRLELIETNAKIFATMIPQLKKESPDAIFVIVTNPCDVLTMLAVEQTGADPARMFASGCVLDSSRFRWLLGEKAGIAPRSVHASIVGEHGDTEFPLWSTATIGQVPLLEWTRDGEKVFAPEDLDDIAEKVRNAAYEIIEGKGATNYAIGLSGAVITEAIMQDSNSILPVSPVLSGYKGIDGVALSVPCIVNADGAHPIHETTFSEKELDLLQKSAHTLTETANNVRSSL